MKHLLFIEHSPWSYMEKIYLQLAFITLFIATYCQCAHAMHQPQARVMPEPHVIIPLKNGTTASAQVTFDTHLAVVQAIDNNAGFAVRELIQTCRDHTSVMSPEACQVLRPYGLVNEENKPNPALINIILSMAKGDCEHLKIVNPREML